MQVKSASQLLFAGAPPAVQGSATVLLLDEAVPPDGGVLGADYVPLSAEEGEWSPAAATALRRASVCVDGAQSEVREGGALGIAPGMRLVHALQPQLSQQNIEQLGALLVEHDAHVLGLCAPTHRPLVAAERAVLARLACGEDHLSALLLAPTGSALGGWAIEVGVDDDSDLGELTLAPGLVAARTPDQHLGHISAESAAVPMAAGLAALWRCRLAARSSPVHPAVLQAVLFATSSSITGRRVRRLDGSALHHDEEVAVRWLPDWEGEATFGLTSHRSDMTLVVVHCPNAQSPLWISPMPTTGVEVRGATVRRSERYGRALVLELDVEPGAQLDCTVRVSGEDVGHGIALAVHHGTLRDRARQRVVLQRRPFTILGISASHDASACLMRDGELVHAIQLERITRKKRDGYPTLDTREAADYCLRAAGLRAKDVDLFAFNCQPLGPEYVGLSLPSHDADFDLFDPFSERALFVSHHLCHAFAAFFASPFSDATVFVCDGAGGTTVGEPDLMIPGPALADYLAGPAPADGTVHCTSTYRFDVDGFRLVDREFARSFSTLCGSSSLGETYAAVTQYVFGNWQEAGKLMGLAPYGDPERFGPSLLARDAAGRLGFRADWKNHFRRVRHRRDPMEYKDLAARVQRDLELALIERVRDAIGKAGVPRVAYSGGVALNSVANQRLRMETGATGLYVLPASNDAGIAIGAAAAAHFHVTRKTRGTKVTSDFLGYSYKQVDYQSALTRYAPLLSRHEVQISDVADRLAAGQVIGWFDGAAEFGPRALGHRSILAAATDQDMWRYVNARIKYREDFRPFAPMVPEEVAGEYFELDEPSPHMLRVVQVKRAYRDRLGAITHVDGTARVQTVNASQLPEIHRLLHAYGARTGIPVLVNTSLNVRGEPVVETPEQAIEMLLATHLDAMVLGTRTLVEPYRASPDAGLDLASVIALPPKTKLEANITRESAGLHIVAVARGSMGYDLPRWVFDLLSAADGRASLDELFRALPKSVDRAAALRVLDSLYQLRLVVTVDRKDQSDSPRAQRQEPAPDAPSIGRSPSWQGLESIFTDLDRRPLAPGCERVVDGADTLARVRPALNRLGVGRVADVTSYDVVGIPVVSCIRPHVDESDITGTQGKGLTESDALTSAIMETVERYSAWHHDAIPIERASQSALRMQQRSFVAPEAFGWVAADADDLEWVVASSLRTGERKLVPAGEVLCPYKPSAGVATAAWSSTGLSSGNTLAEAIAHGLCEVVERDALSRFIDGTPARLLDLESIADPACRELLARFRTAELDVYVIDLSGIALMACYSVCLFDPFGVEPRIAAAGQGAALSARTALRRALLEAAQCRVVAIQGSREDLERHASRWVEDDVERLAKWESSKLAAGRGGTATMPVELDASASISDLLCAELDVVARHGCEDAFFVDLTNAKIGVPVVRVLVPDLFDGEADPSRRRRGAR